MKKENKKISKAAMTRLMKSDFFCEVLGTVKAWDYYVAVGDKELAGEMMSNWLMARSALEFITGNIYKLSRNGETYSVENEFNKDEKIIIGIGHSVREMAA